MSEFYLEVTAIAENNSGEATVRIDKDSRITHIRFGFGGPGDDVLAFDLNYEPCVLGGSQDSCLLTCLLQVIGYAEGTPTPMTPWSGTETATRSNGARIVVSASDPRVQIEEQLDQGYYTVRIGEQEATAVLGDLLAAQQALYFDRYPAERVEAQN